MPADVVIQHVNRVDKLRQRVQPEEVDAPQHAAPPEAARLRQRILETVYFIMQSVERYLSKGGIVVPL